MLPRTAQILLPVEADPSLCGRTFVQQWVDYAGTGIDFGTSAAVELTVGF